MRRQPLVLIGVFLLLSILILLNNNSAPVKFITGFTQGIFSAPKTFLYGLQTKLGRDESIEIQSLKEENARLVKQFIEFGRIKKDNEALRSQFEAGTAKNYRLMPAHVIGFLGKPQYPSSLIIDLGETDGIKAGMAAIVEQNLIGKIGKVSQNYSEVVLVNNKNFGALARTAGDVSGIIAGQEDFILFDRVAVNENIEKDEMVLTKGEINDSGFGSPPDFIIGKIVSVSRSESLPFQAAKVASVVNISKLHMIFIITTL